MVQALDVIAQIVTGDEEADRDATMLCLLYNPGLRRAEVVGLNVGDYDRDGQRLLVRGKRQQRSLPTVAGAASALTCFVLRNNSL